MKLSFSTRNDAILEQLDTFVVATGDNQPALNLEPFGLTVRWVIDPTKRRSGTFLDLLQRLDALTFGPEGMPMDKWVFYNCAELPGFIYGFALPADELSQAERELFGCPVGYDGPVPFSMYIAIPMFEDGAWFGHNLASLNATFPHRSLGGLGRMTKAIALKAFGARTFFGATQWLSKALFIHTKFGPLDVTTAYTPAHSIPETLTYGFTVTDESLRAACGDKTVTLHRPEPTLHLEGTDVEGMRAVQADIEAGARYQMVGAPSMQAGQAVHRLAKL